MNRRLPHARAGRWRLGLAPAMLAMATAFAAPASAGDITLESGITLERGMALARENVCLGCHQVDARRVGPPFRAIGERFARAGEREASLDYLVGVIQKGGRGKWGALTMPAQPQVKDDEAQQLAEWILGLGEENAAR